MRAKGAPSGSALGRGRLGCQAAEANETLLIKTKRVRVGGWGPRPTSPHARKPLVGWSSDQPPATSDGWVGGTDTDAGRCSLLPEPVKSWREVVTRRRRGCGGCGKVEGVKGGGQLSTTPQLGGRAARTRFGLWEAI